MNQQGRQLLGDPLLAPVTFTPRRQLVPFLRGFLLPLFHLPEFLFRLLLPPGEVFHPFIGLGAGFQGRFQLHVQFPGLLQFQSQTLRFLIRPRQSHLPLLILLPRGFQRYQRPFQEAGVLLPLFFLRGDLDLGRFHGLPQALPLDPRLLQASQLPLQGRKAGLGGFHLLLR